MRAQADETLERIADARRKVNVSNPSVFTVTVEQLQFNFSI